MILSMHQPEYLPYLGHIAKIAMADLHIFYDDVQYEQGGFQNRNRILRDRSWGWITVPVIRQFRQKIYQVRINGSRWKTDHAKTIRQYYRSDALQDIYESEWERLADLNIAMIAWILNELQISVPTLRSKDLGVKSVDRTDRVIEICKKVGATTFISGMGARAYLNEKQFILNGIKLIYNDWKDMNDPPLSSIHYLLTDGRQSVIRKIVRHVHHTLDS